MKTFGTACGKEFIVDDEDYMLAMEHPWILVGGYVRCRLKNGDTVSLHRLIIGAKKGDTVDHIDGNPLNNQRNNLRICTPRQNSINKKPWSTNKRGGGVKLSRNGVKWEAYIRIGKNSYNLGRYNTEEEAKIAYNDVAETLHGEYARKYKLD